MLLVSGRRRTPCFWIHYARDSRRQPRASSITMLGNTSECSLSGCARDPVGLSKPSRDGDALRNAAAPALGLAASPRPSEPTILSALPGRMTDPGSLQRLPGNTDVGKLPTSSEFTDWSRHRVFPLLPHQRFQTVLHEKLPRLPKVFCSAEVRAPRYSRGDGNIPFFPPRQVLGAFGMQDKHE